MPELGEIHWYASLLNQLSGRHVVEFTICGGGQPPLTTTTLTSVRPFGKEIIFEFDGGTVIMTVHLKMNGYFMMGTCPAKNERNRLWSMKFEDGHILSLHDDRRWASTEFSVSARANTEKRGPDPILDPDGFRHNILNNVRKDKFFEKKLHRVFSRSEQKAQKYFNGIGNIMRAELIHRLGWRPFAEAHSVMSDRLLVDDLLREIQTMVNLTVTHLRALCSKIENLKVDYRTIRTHLSQSQVYQCYQHPNAKSFEDGGQFYYFD